MLKVKLITQLLAATTFCGAFAPAFGLSITNLPKPSANLELLSDNSTVERIYLPRRGELRRCFVTSDLCIFKEQFHNGITLHSFVGLGSRDLKAILQAEIAAKLAAGKDYRRATIVARAITDPLLKVAALTQIAAQYGKAGQVNQAQQILSEAEQAAGNRNNVKAIVSIAVQYAALGQKHTASQIFKEVLELQSSKDSINAVEISNATVITTGLLASGKISEAEQMVRRILQNDQHRRNQSYWLVKCPSEEVSYPVSDPPKDGDYSFKQCQKTITPRAPGLPNYYDSLMEPFIEAQKTDIAIRVIKEEIHNSSDRDYTLYQVCQDLALLGEVDRALQILQTIPGNRFSRDISNLQRVPIAQNSFNSGVPALIAEQKSSLEKANYSVQLAERGKFKDALLAAQTIQLPYHKLLTLTEIAIKLMGSGQLGLAQQILSQAIQVGKTLTSSYIDFGEQQGLGDIAIRLIEVKQFSQSFKVVNMITNKPYKIAVLINIADIYLQTGKTPAALKILSNAFEETELLR